MASSSLYHDDIVLWSEEQSNVLRRMAQTRRDLPNELDIENVAEEIESVGRSELASGESFLRLFMLHLIKIASLPDSSAVPHWRDEARNFRADALTRFASSMGQRLNLDRAWSFAREQALESVADHCEPAVDLPQKCPWNVGQLVQQKADLDGLIAVLSLSGTQVQSGRQRSD
jgi:hypothetical protein